MTKAELEEGKGEYDAIVRECKSLIKKGEIAKAVKQAQSAWRHVVAFMKFGKKYLEVEHESTPCVDIVLRYAPLTLDLGSLNNLGELLKRERSIDRIASDDLAARLADAKVLIFIAYRLWCRLEKYPECTTDALVNDSGGTGAECRKLINEWKKLNFVSETRRGSDSVLRLSSGPRIAVTASCFECGNTQAGLARSFFTPVRCDGCGKEGPFVILDESVVTSNT